MDRDDQEIDNYLDNILGTEDGSEPDGGRDESEEPEEPRGPRESSFFGDESDEDDDEEDDDPDGGEDDDEEDDDEDEGDEEEDGSEGALDPADARLKEGEARLKAIAEAVQKQQLEAGKVLKYEQTAQKFKDIKAHSTDEEWSQFTNQFLKFVENKEVKKVEQRLHDQQVIVAAYQMTEQMERQSAEDAAGKSLALTAAEQNLGRLSATERRLLENSTDRDFLDNYNFIKTARSNATEPAREALRTKRQQRGADRPPVRETGGARSVTKTYDNYSNMDAFFDDLIPDQSVPRRT